MAVTLGSRITLGALAPCTIRVRVRVRVRARARVRVRVRVRVGVGARVRVRVSPNRHGGLELLVCAPPG